MRGANLVLTAVTNGVILERVTKDCLNKVIAPVKNCLVIVPGVAGNATPSGAATLFVNASTWACNAGCGDASVSGAIAAIIV